MITIKMESKLDDFLSSLQEGDVGICTDTNRVYMKTSGGWQTIAYNSSSNPISDINTLTPDAYGHLSLGVNNLSNVTTSSASNSQGLIFEVLIAHAIPQNMLICIPHRTMS
jgi:hypothetical protein